MNVIREYFAVWTLEDWGDLAVIAVALVIAWILFGSDLVLVP